MAGSHEPCSWAVHARQYFFNTQMFMGALFTRALWTCDLLHLLNGICVHRVDYLMKIPLWET